MEQKRAKLLQRIHKEYLKCWSACTGVFHCEDEFLYNIFKNRYNFYHESGKNQEREEKDNKNAWERWKETRMTFEDANLPELVTDFFQEGPRQENQPDFLSPSPSGVENKSASAEAPEKRGRGRPAKVDK